LFSQRVGLTQGENMFGATELIIILVIVVVLFGVGRLGKIGGELGTGIRAFRDGISGDEDEDVDEKGKE
jgi:sec-independent protein translocase protein TatA